MAPFSPGSAVTGTSTMRGACSSTNGTPSRRRSSRTLSAWIELDVAFHRRLLEASGLAPLVAFNDLLQIFFARFRESVKRAEWRHAIHSHQRIVDLLARGKVRAASDELQSHIESHRERMEAGA